MGWCKGESMKILRKAWSFNTNYRVSGSLFLQANFGVNYSEKYPLIA